MLNGLRDYQNKSEYRQQMRSGNMPTYLSLNCPLSGMFMFMFLMLFCSSSGYFQVIQLVLKLWTDGPTDGHILLERCENASKKLMFRKKKKNKREKKKRKNENDKKKRES